MTPNKWKTTKKAGFRCIHDHLSPITITENLLVRLEIEQLVVE